MAEIRGKYLANKRRHLATKTLCRICALAVLPAPSRAKVGKASAVHGTCQEFDRVATTIARFREARASELWLHCNGGGDVKLWAVTTGVVGRLLLPRKHDGSDICAPRKRIHRNRDEQCMHGLGLIVMLLASAALVALFITLYFSYA